MEEVMMTVKEVADFLKISERSAHTFIHNKNFIDTKSVKSVKNRFF